MHLVLNAANGDYIDNILLKATAQLQRRRNSIEKVDAAVAYASDTRLLFPWCIQNSVRLNFWGRFDESVPVAVPVLEWFLSQRSPNYVCKLVRRFHSKVIWWHGLGAYIGSANIGQSAWYSNFEAGVFLSDQELAARGLSRELEDYFIRIDADAEPLSDEILDLLRRRSTEMAALKRTDRERANAHLATKLVRDRGAPTSVNRSQAGDRRRLEFLEEWRATLQIIRDIGTRVSASTNRPQWIRDDAPVGAQADQFLHAHYYQRTHDDNGRANYEEHFHRARGNPEAAVAEAIAWWRELDTAPNNEDRTLNEWAPRLRDLLAQDRLLTLTEDEFVEMSSRVHAMIDYARRVSNAAVNLPAGRRYTMDEKIDALARRLFRERPHGTSKILDNIYYVLYQGGVETLPDRIWSVLEDPGRRLPHFGVSALGEIVGWALPDLFPPRNGRTSKALKSLGYDVRVHV